MTTDSKVQPEIDAIVDEILTSGKTVPEGALKNALGYRQEIIPALIRIVEDGAAALDKETMQGTPCLTAMMLLAEFRATEAWPVFRDAMLLSRKLTDDSNYELFTGEFAHLVAIFGSENVNEVQALVGNRELGEPIRWLALDAIKYLIREQKLAREQAIEWLTRELEDAIEAEDEFAEHLVGGLSELGADEKWPLVERFYDRGICTNPYLPKELMAHGFRRGKKRFDLTMRELAQFSNALSELKKWESLPDDEDYDI